MKIKTLTSGLSVSEQIVAADFKAIREGGFRAVICNRPDGEGADQPTFEEIARAAKQHRLNAAYLPIVSGKVSDDDTAAFAKALTELPGPVLAYCRTGTRSATLWSLTQAGVRPLIDILAATRAAGYDMSGVARRIANDGNTPTQTGDASYEVVIGRAGAGGIAMASSRASRYWKSTLMTPPISTTMSPDGAWSAVPDGWTLIRRRCVTRHLWQHLGAG